jgi:hypothetical protein
MAQIQKNMDGCFVTERKRPASNDAGESVGPIDPVRKTNAQRQAFGDRLVNRKALSSTRFSTTTR